MVKSMDQYRTYQCKFMKGPATILPLIRTKLVHLCRQKVKAATSLPARRLTRFYPAQWKFKKGFYYWITQITVLIINAIWFLIYFFSCRFLSRKSCIFRCNAVRLAQLGKLNVALYSIRCTSTDPVSSKNSRWIEHFALNISSCYN